MDMGTDIARNVHTTAMAAPTEAPEQRAQAFERAARCVRRTIILAEHLDKPPRDAKPDPAERRIQVRKKIIRRMEDRLYLETPETARALHAELLERLESPDTDADLDTQPVDRIIFEMTDDMDLNLLPFRNPRPRRTPKDIARIADIAAQRPTTPADTPENPAPYIQRQGPLPPDAPISKRTLALADYLAPPETGPPRKR